MCTLILLYKMLEDYPVILAENRDIFMGTGEIPPHIASVNPRVYCAKDKKSGGTWFGLNGYGVAAGLTNLYSNTGEIKPVDSIGRLFVEALKQPDAEEVSRYLQDRFIPGKYRKANILAADENSAILTMCDKSIDAIRLSPGIHVLTNYNLKHKPEKSDDIDTFVDSVHRRDQAIKLLKYYGIRDKKDIDDVIRVLQRVLSDHENAGNVVSVGDYFKICCHGDPEIYDWETKSSSIAALSKNGIEKSMYFYCPGNPCTVAYDDYSAILREAA